MAFKQAGTRSRCFSDTIRSFESGRIATLSAINQEAVQKALEKEGVQFLSNGEIVLGDGVALK